MTEPRGLYEQLARVGAGDRLECNCAVVFTDVVDSTRMSAQLGDSASARQWAAHDKASRDALRQWGGVEIDRSDGMLLLFADASHALGWAVAYHAALARLEVPMAARAGVHVGPMIVRRNAAEDVAQGAKMFEADGLAKPLAARIMALASGGQTLLSQAAREALGSTSGALQSHGHWRLKGVPDPVELHEADATGEWRPPVDGDKAHRVILKDGTWVAAAGIAHTLPAQRNTFVGREAVIGELWRRFESGARLVTVTGLGGIGKTRLAIGFGARARGAFPGGVWFCDLSQARDAASVAGAIARGLDVTLDKGDAASRLLEVIQGRVRCLIILDNAEQVAADAALCVGEWLDRAADAAFLVTSRQSLGLPGEVVQSLDSLAEAEARALFEARARELAPGYAVAAEDTAALDELVRVLNGLPLAIELAAARARLMPPRALLARMSERFRVLAAPGARGGRQATLRATFDWSWELLSDAERATLAQLSVFQGGFALAEAEAVVDLASIAEAPWVPDLIHSLLDKSLLRASAQGRFGLLASVREYASEQLRTAGRFPGSGPECADSALRRAVGYFATAGDAVVTADGCANLDNAIAACRHALARGWADCVDGTLAAAWAGLALRGPPALGLELAQTVDAMPLRPEAARGTIERVLGSAQLALGNIDQAESHLARSLECARSTNDPRLEAVVQLALGHAAIAQARAPDAERHYEEAAAIARRIGASALECEAANGIGNVHYIRSRPAQARHAYGEALALADAAGFDWMQCAIHSNLGNIAMGQGELDAARPEFEAAVALARRCGRRLVEANTLCNLGWLAHLQGDAHDSIRLCEEALDVARHLGNVTLEGVVLCNLAIADEAAARIARAQERFEQSVALARRVGDTRREAQFLNYFGLLHFRQGQYDAAGAHLTRGEALLRAGDDRMSLATVLCALARLRHAQGETAHAARTWDEARAIAVDLGTLPGSELGVALAGARAALDA